MKEYTYGAMSSKFKLQAPNKLTAYAAMLIHYQDNAHLLVIYSPDEAKQDSWFNIEGKIQDRLDEIFGGKDALEKYLETHIDEINQCYSTIQRVV